MEEKRYWIGESSPDHYAAFRGTFVLESACDVTIRLFGVSWYLAFLDGEEFAEGPHRFAPNAPEYSEIRVHLSAGRHILASIVHAEGVVTRIIQDVKPFYAAELESGGKRIAVSWKACPLCWYSSQVHRVNPQLGWIEWCDTREQPYGFTQPAFDDSAWSEPEEVKTDVPVLLPPQLKAVGSIPAEVKEIGRGELCDIFGYQSDDPSAVFSLRGRKGEYPADGIWIRYDLQKVRLFRFRLILEAPAGTIVQVAYSEYLTVGKVMPFITLSAGSSCNLDHYILRGGRQTVFNVTPRGGRFVEFHILGDPSEIRVIKAEFLDRTYYGKPVGEFRCGEALLETIWSTGVETLRSCAEDAVIDNPTRERGEWTGDVISVGMAIAGAAYGDFALIREGLRHSALCASPEGLIAGLCPGGVGYLSTYALQWVSACVEYYENTGDVAFLEEMYPHAEKNLDYFRARWSDKGVSRDIYWDFVDWGYVTNDGPSDMAVNLHLLNALVSMLRWQKILHREGIWKEFEKEVRVVCAAYLAQRKGDWKTIGLHRSVLALGCGFFEGEEKKQCLEFVKKHYLSCFPNDPEAPRLGAPNKNNPQLITPYFSHYAFPFLWKNGEGDFVLGQYRTCWGWMLEEGRTTWLEVFDERWSHCHQWSGCPTWQLSSYVLGLRRRYDLAPQTFEFVWKKTSLPFACGKIPIDLANSISVEWKTEGNQLRYFLKPTCEIFVLIGGKEERVGTEGKYFNLEI